MRTWVFLNKENFRLRLPLLYIIDLYIVKIYKRIIVSYITGGLSWAFRYQTSFHNVYNKIQPNFFLGLHQHNPLRFYGYNV